MMRFTALRRLRHELRSFIADERGSYLAFTAFLLMGVVGFAGMGIDLSMWYQEKRATQNMADAAAVAAVHVSQRGGDMTAMQAAALAEATRNGFKSGPNNSVTVVPSTATPVGTAVAVVDVEVRREVPLFMLAVFKEEEQIIAAGASGGTLSQGNYCVIGLDNPQPNNTTSQNVTFIGNNTNTIPCGVHSDSTTADSLYIDGNVTLLGTPASATGGITIGGNATVSSQITMQSNFGYVPDPLQSRVTSFPDRDTVNAYACDAPAGLVINSDVTIDPYVDGDADGIYKICGDFEVKPGRTLTLHTGIYYVHDGNILFQGIVQTYDGDADGEPEDRITIVLSGSSAATVGEVDIRAQAVVQLWATNDDASPYKGIVFYQQNDATTDHDNQFNGGASLDVRGYVYLRNNRLTYNGGSADEGCTYVIAKSITFTGNSDTNINVIEEDCEEVGIGAGPVQNQVVLVQ
jgi:hypothetical protein